jgi:3D (Asp-Asp-Asp) domain-containing protein
MQCVVNDFSATIHRAMRHETHDTPRQRAGLVLALSLLALPSLTRADGGPIRYPGRWQLTQYWIARERAGERDRRASPLFSRGGRAITYACPTFVTDLTMEGTGLTWDDRLLNWDGREQERACFVEVDRGSYPYGIGVQGFSLVPYRSLAVDRRYIPVGHTVEMSELAGLRLPDGSVHDGCFVAVDGGGAIVGHHIDLFVPSQADWQRLSVARQLPSSVRSVVVDAPRCRSAQRFAWIPLAADPALAR